MKMNSVCAKMSLVAMAVGGILCTRSAEAAPITVSNHSFESGGGGLTDWSTTGGTFNYHASDNGLDPRPDGTPGNAFSNGGSGYQELGTAVQANMTYTLTVDLGDRTNTGFPNGSTEIRLGVGPTFGDNLLLMTAETRPVPTSGWQTWTVTFESGPSPAAGNLRIELLGNTQSQFDNVRLDAVASAFDPSSPWEAYVRNHTFEYDGKTFWSGSIGGPYQATASPTLYDPSPDPDDGDYIVHTDASTGYQVLNTMPLEANHTYTLTIDIGDRNGLNFVGAELRMGTGSTVGNNLLTATVVSNTVPFNAPPGNVDTNDGWETWISTFTAGSGVVGDPLRVEMASSGQRTHWDNVRLSVTPPVAGAINWTVPAASNASATQAEISADVTEDLDLAVLVWDTSDQDTNSIGAWAGSNVIGPTNSGTVTAPATNLMADTLYTVRYYGSNATDEGWSEAATFSTALTAVQKPVFTSAVLAEWNLIQLGWQDNASNETGYELYRSTDGANFSLLASLAADSTTYSDSPVAQTPATLDPVTYTYRLAATNAANGSATAPADCQTNAVATPPDSLILYDSFEDPDIMGLGGTDPTGWIVPGGGINDEDSGKFTTPYGDQALWLNSGSATTTVSILSAVLKEGYTYTLSYNIGKRNDHGGNYVASLLAGATTLASTNGTPTQTDFSESDEIVFTPDGSHAALLGQTLVIQFARDTSLQPHFDNVLLLAAPPGTAGAAGTLFLFR